jgi:hypothetical protein
VKNTWVSFVNVETKEQSKLWMYTHSTNICQKTDGNCLLGQERSADGGFMQEGTTITS